VRCPSTFPTPTRPGWNLFPLTVRPRACRGGRARGRPGRGQWEPGEGDALARVFFSSQKALPVSAAPPPPPPPHATHRRWAGLCRRRWGGWSAEIEGRWGQAEAPRRPPPPPTSARCLAARSDPSIGRPPCAAPARARIPCPTPRLHYGHRLAGLMGGSRGRVDPRTPGARCRKGKAASVRWADPPLTPLSRLFFFPHLFSQALPASALPHSETPTPPPTPTMVKAKHLCLAVLALVVATAAPGKREGDGRGR
jgi:hypothetical protein